MPASPTKAKAKPSAAVPQEPQPDHWEAELPGSKAVISRDGDRPIIEPARKNGLTALLDRGKPLDEEFPEIADTPPTPKDIL